MTYYEKNKNARLNYQKQYYQENKQEIIQYTKNYYSNNKEILKKKRKEKYKNKNGKNQKTNDVLQMMVIKNNFDILITIIIFTLKKY